MLNQAARFTPVVRLVTEVTGTTLLDVGSGSTGIAAWLPHGWHVTAVDRSWDDYGSATGPASDDGTVRVKADVRDLPFADAAFDVVVALDILEHIPPPDRRAVLDELRRVAARRLIVACPTGIEALGADRRLAERYAAGPRPAPVWLTEHLEHGFPEPEELADLLPGTRLVANESVAAHERLTKLEARRWGAALSARSAALLRAAPQALREPVSRLLRGRDRLPAYRTIAVLDFSR